MKKHLNAIIIILVAGISLAAGIWLSQKLQGGSGLPKHLQATVLDKPRSISPFTLVNHDGKPFTEQALKGHWDFMFFGFTNCPDICPTALTVMQGVWKKLPGKSSDANYPRMYFVSVDPDRDKPENMKQYVGYFDSSFVGVTGNIEEIDKLTNQLGILYGYDDSKDGSENYNVNHSAQILLIDPQGRMRAVISPPHDANRIAQEFQEIRKHFGE